MHIKGRVASLLEVGTGFHPELTGRENIYLNGSILGMTRGEIRNKFEEIVAFAEVEKFIDTPVKRYSSGMYVRLAFSVAAHLEPEILLIDEILAVGDMDFQKKCLGRIKNIGSDGRTVLLVSHNLPIIANTCERVILLNSGKLVEDGEPSEVINKYLTMQRSAGGTVIWDDPARAPGNEVFRLYGVSILQDGIEGPTNDVDISKDIIIQILYINHQKGARLYSGIWLRNNMGVDVLASDNATSVSLTEDTWYGRPYPPRCIPIYCRIPSNFLNEGRYSVTAIVGKIASDTHVLEKDIVSFDVYDTGDMRKEFYGGWLGVVRPRLAWDTEYVGHAPETLNYSGNIY